MRNLLLASSALILAACGAATDNGTAEAETHAKGSAATVGDLKLGKAGTYTLDPSHTSIIWSVPHFGLSNYTGRFPRVAATLVWNPEDASANSLTATIDVASVSTDYVGNYKAGHADSGYDTWNAQLGREGKWLDADANPKITFTSTSVTATGRNTGTVTGDLTFRGVTKPVTLDVIYNGVANFPWAPEQDKIGFSATTTLNREDFGLTAYAPKIGTDVKIRIETEFSEVME